MAGERAARGGLYKNPGGSTYKFRYKQNGREIYGDTGCTSLGAAREWLLAHRQGAAQRKVGILTADNVPTLKKAMELWKTAAAGVVTEKYANQKIDRLTNHLGPELVLPIHLIDTEVVEKARQRYLSGSWSGNGHRNIVEGRGVGGWNHLLRDLRALMSWAVKRGLIEAIPFRVTATKVQEDPASGVVIWPELTPAFLAEVDRLPVFRQDTRTAVKLMLFMGLREDEALTSRWEWLDHRNMTYTVGDAKNRRARSSRSLRSSWTTSWRTHKTQGRPGPNPACRRQREPTRGRADHQAGARGSTGHWDSGDDAAPRPCYIRNCSF